MPAFPTGAHVERANPLAGAASRGAEVIQINLSSPQMWKAPVPHPTDPDLAAHAMPVFCHGPFLVNPASIRPEIRARSVDCLVDHLTACDRIGAAGLVVHGGHPTGAGTVDDAVAGWVEVLQQLSERGEWATPLLIENTAGGKAAVARHPDDFARLWDAIAGGPVRLGTCFDTAHAWSSGEMPAALAAAITAISGPIGLVHVNQSDEVPGSGRDKHVALTAGSIPEEEIIGALVTAAAPAVIETPGGVAEHLDDLAWLRQRLA